MNGRRPTTAPRAVLAATTSAAAAGLWLGLLLAVVTAARNDFHSLLDVLRLQLALGFVFAALAAAAGAGLGLLLAAALPRTRPRAGVLSFAVTVSTVAAVWCARAFEFRAAYPHSWEVVDGYAGMMAVAIAFLAAVMVGAMGLAWVLVRVATRAAAAGMTAGRASVVAVAMALLAAVILAGRPDPEVERAEAAAAPLPGELGLADIVRPSDHRVLLVGCDGATWDVVDPLLAEGELPNLRGLIERGVRAPLATLPDRPSPSLWTSIASSRSPRDTGISDFYVQHVLGASTPVREFPRHFGLNAGLLLRDVLGRGRVKVTPVTSGMVRTRRLWQILGQAGVETGVVNWLVTWPADAGGAAFVVSERTWGALAPDRADGGTVSELVQDANDDDARLWDPPAVAAAFPTDDADWVTEDAFVAATARRLMEDEAPQVMLVYFRDVDAAEHLAWDEWEPKWFPGGKDRPPHRGPVRDAMISFDLHLGTLLDAAGEGTTVIVVSDHGHSAWFTWFGRGTPGGHTDAPDGLFLAAGPGIATTMAEGFRPSLQDITPTVLRLVGLPAAADMEGDVLDGILDDAPVLSRVATWETGLRTAGAALPSMDDEALLERLRALGYVR
jgi:predicted AlkP superfamily phosphohydrolase/phosphomutase